ncbi:multidrug resistance protein B [Bacillus spizizenii TU-B-10]|uniref:Multidrug resistance protein B n=1 Tax=Bacillus spizizenii (strain DSM 15029 / JCM 12233 / NBRC 101239 / NRRL B-23049 / TU-B-10) TaxID=1052585 RepID=G4NUZ6_BACS4|nr:multidrug resistance protein B [Bacillus spizizenii TU-B-10]
MADIITKQRIFCKQLNLSVLYSVCEKYRLKLHAVRLFLRIVRAERSAHLPLLGRLSERFDSRYFLLANSWGMAVLLLYVPHIGSVVQVYIVQVLLGLFGAMQKHGEKVLIANFTDSGERGKKIGNYHFWTAVFSAAAIMLGGFLADFFTVQMIFYASSILYFLSGLMMMKTG